MLQESLLGKKASYVETYSPDLLFPVPRKLARDKIGLTHSLPFKGEDIWNGYELSWLNTKGKPEVSLIELRFPCTSTNLVESKSLKFYLNSFNQSYFDSVELVQKTLERDLGAAAEEVVKVKLSPITNLAVQQLEEFPGICLDSLDIETNTYNICPKFLTTQPKIVEETLFSHLLKSNCLATGQPDWGSVMIRYSGPQIDRKGLLKYIISFRNHHGFAEHCVEQIFCEISSECKPEKLTVYSRYTRRGGSDINPYRSNFESHASNFRQPRQ
jgi:7-cyano-7-deazaguanine reductase